ncbi:MAG: hypothetical protein IIA44_10205 [Acidobacteria bacterium]|nr:hypothetical protein [Acidobacteriota bacterium]
MALMTLSCPNDHEFVMEEDVAKQADLRCPVCDRDVEVPEDDEDEDEDDDDE